jgi:peroxiredoxin family protein
MQETTEVMMNKKATILLQSGDMDKALCVFIFANGYAALGVEVKMWFINLVRRATGNQAVMRAPRRA